MTPPARDAQSGPDLPVPDVPPATGLPTALALPAMDFSPWTTASVAEIAAEVAAACGPGRAIVLVDGSSGSGKTTFARRLAAQLPGTAIVPTDDVAWHLDPINWAQQMLDGVIRPWQSGADVDYRPPGWIAKGRAGSVTASGDGVLIIEGVGAARRELAPHADYLVWVNTDQQMARDRVLVRDIGVDGDTTAQVAEFHAGWMEAEVPFHLTDRPWERADLIVDGGYTDPAGEQVKVVRRRPPNVG